tara:strand:+ start:159 stop:359 length:201 start_codon:yes stop_codon:yes gene_type:complete
MKIKDILNKVKPVSRLSVKDPVTKRFKRRRQKDFHTKPDFGHKFKVSNITKRIKGALCDDINNDTE